MKRMLLVLLALVFISPMISIGAEKDSISVKLVWEKEFSEEIIDVAFQGIDSLIPKIVVTGDNPYWGCKRVYFFDKEGKVINFRKLMGAKFDKYGNIINPWAYGGVARAIISQNGKYVGIFEPKKFTGKEGEPIGEVEIVNSSGITVNRFPLRGWCYWVSPYGDEIISSSSPIMDRPIFTVVNKEGGEIVDLLKTNKPEYMLGNKFKVIKWRNSNKLQDLVIVNKEHNYFMKASRFLYDAINDFANGLLETNPNGKWFAIRNSEKVSILNKEGELINKYPVEFGTGLAMSIDGHYLSIPTKLHSMYIIEISDEKAKIQKVSLPIKEKTFNAFQPQALKGYHAFEITASGEIVIDGEDSILFNNKRIFSKKLLNIKRGAKIIGLRINTTEKTLCIITDKSIRIYSINIKGGEK